MTWLFPADPLRPRRPDAHFAPEARAARDAGHPVALVDHDALAGAGDPAEAVARVPEGAGPAVYRGWMLPAERYAGMAGALARRGVTLRTSADQYRRAHELPGWYPALSSVTPVSVWTDGVGRTAFLRALADLGPGPAVLRDHAKSLKHHWDEAAFIPDTRDTTAAWTVASRFRELRGADLTGGFVLRRFEEFVGAEVRTWWVDGRCALVGAHPDTADQPPPDDVDPGRFAGLVAALDLPLVTVDLVRRVDGVWRVVELGDGQVSDRPTSLTPDRLVAALAGEGGRRGG